MGLRQFDISEQARKPHQKTDAASEAKQSRSSQQIASVAPLLRNDSFFIREKRWRCGVTGNDRWVGDGLERDLKAGGDADQGPLTMDDLAISG
jgi:hypothetical protein